MTQSSVLALGVATAVLQQLQAVRALSSAPCLNLSEQIATLTAHFLDAPITPAATLDFETDLRRLLDDGETDEPPPGLAARTVTFVIESTRRNRSILDFVPVTVPVSPEAVNLPGTQWKPMPSDSE